MASEDIVRGGLGTLVKVRAIGGGQATVTSMITAQAAIAAAQTDKAESEIEKQVKTEQKAVLEARQAEIVAQKDSWQAIVDDGGSSSEAVDEAESQIDSLEDEEAENDTTIDALDTLITTLTSEISTAQTTIDTQTTTIETLEEIAQGGAYAVIPNVEEPKIPSTKQIMDKFRPIDNSTNGYEVVKPTGAKESTGMELTIVWNAFDSVHQQLRYAIENATRLDFMVVMTDGWSKQFFGYIEELEPIIAADKLNRSKIKIMPDGRVLNN